MIERFNYTGDLSEDIEVFKNFLGYKYQSNKLIITKKTERVYLVHANDNIDNTEKYNGKIYVLSKNGIIGLLEYEAVKIPYVITIKDLQFKEPDFYGIGLGSGLIKFLEEYARTEKVILIKGALEPYDIEHNKEKLINFYTKYDFNIDLHHREVKKIIIDK